MLEERHGQLIVRGTRDATCERFAEQAGDIWEDVERAVGDVERDAGNRRQQLADDITTLTERGHHACDFGAHVDTAIIGRQRGRLSNRGGV